MSWQATDAVDQLPYDVCGPLAFRVLVKLANVADQEGKRAFRSKSAIADELGVSARSVQRAFRELEEGHLVRPGDQRLVSHLPANRRPIVYDIIMRRTGAVQVTLSGETEFSTGDDDTPAGETAGETTAVRHKELRELDNSSTQGEYRGGALSCAHPRIDATHCTWGCRPNEARS